MTLNRSYSRSSPAPSLLPLRRYPVDLVTVMAVCDGNYLRMLKLLPELSLNSRRVIGLPVPDSAVIDLVEFQVVESFRYTSTIAIKLNTPGMAATPYYRPPIMLVRLYHDACTAEVVSYQEKTTSGFQMLLAESVEFTPDEKDQVNQFLAEWLQLCLQEGLVPKHQPPGKDTPAGIVSV